MARGEMRPEGDSRSRRRFLLAGAIAVPVLLAVGLILVVALDGSDAAPRAQIAQTVTPAPKPPPETHPTRGEYVPPKPTPTATRTPEGAPKPTVRPTVTASRSREARHREECPRRLRKMPAWKRWCDRNGYRTR